MRGASELLELFARFSRPIFCQTHVRWRRFCNRLVKKGPVYCTTSEVGAVNRDRLVAVVGEPNLSGKRGASHRR